MTECADSLSKQHDFETRPDWMGDPSIPNGTTSWDVKRCRHCGHEQIQCDCGAWFDPVGDDGEDLTRCANCEQNRAEAEYDRQQEEGFRGGEWAAAQAAEQDRIRRELK